MKGIDWERALAESPDLFFETLEEKRGIINDNLEIHANDWRIQRGR